jgi:lipoyl(octanoyl) transferase
VVAYGATYEAMRAFTQARNPETADEIWLCQHPAVYTLGLSAKRSDIVRPSDIPVVQTDRGGQVTYHGPGQVVAYPLIDLKRHRVFVKEYVYRLEQSVLRTLESLGVTGHRVPSAPGIFVKLADPFGHSALTGPRRDLFDGLAKIAAVGVKVSRHCTYHGVALNVCMDLEPFSGINACGYPGLRTVDLASLGLHPSVEIVTSLFGQWLAREFTFDGP